MKKLIFIVFLIPGMCLSQNKIDLLTQSKIGTVTSGLSIVKGANTVTGIIQPSGALQVLRVNAGNTAFEFVAPASLGLGTVTSIATTAPITGGPITGTGTIAITQSTTSTDGYLNSTDWNTFNNKQAALTTGTLSASTPISLSASRSVIGGSAAISIADAAADGSTKGAASFTAADFNATAGNISLDYTNGQKATGSVPGFLSSTDWTTFNNKGSGTVTSVATGLGLSGGTITTTGTLLVDTANASILSRQRALHEYAPISINGTVTSFTATDGNGFDFSVSNSTTTPTLTATTTVTNKQVMYSSSNAIAGSANLIWDNSNSRLGVLQGTPTSAFHLNKDQNSVTQDDANGILLANATAATVGLQSISPGLVLQGNGWKTTATAASQDTRFRLDVLPVQGSTNPTSTLQFSSSVNAAAYTVPMKLDNIGNLTVLADGSNNFNYICALSGFSSLFTGFPSNSCGFFGSVSGSQGGLAAGGFATNGGSAFPCLFDGYWTNTTAGSSLPTICFRSFKNNGSNVRAALAATELSFQFRNNTTVLMTGLGGGQVAIGTSTAPTSWLHLAAGTTATAPLGFTSGTNLTTPVAGKMEYDGTNLFFSPSTTRYTVSFYLAGSATLNFGSTAAQSSADLTITVTGAAVSDPVELGVDNASILANSNFFAWVSATNTVTVRFNNYSTGAQDPASGTFKVKVTKN